MKHSSFPSKEELVLQCNTTKRRQERIIQVRQQSKRMSAAILERVKQEARKQCEEIENLVLSEIRNYHRKELENSRKQYEKCISEINQRHHLQQINMNDTNVQTVNRSKLRNPSPVKSVTSTTINNVQNAKKLTKDKLIIKSLEQQTSPARNPREKLCNKKVELKSPKKFSKNEIDSDDNGIERYPMLNFRKHSPEVKLLRSIQSANENKNRPRCRGMSPCLNPHKSKLIHSKAIDDYALVSDKSNKTQIDEMYNHLVHDRIRVLEQKDKILERRTMFLPNGVKFSKKPLLFSEYFARVHNSKISSKNISHHSTTGTEETDDDEKIKSNIKRIDRKKKLLKEELIKSSNESHSSKNISSHEKKQSKNNLDLTPVCNKEQTAVSKSDKNSSSSNSEGFSTKKISPRSKLCPSPILKAICNVDNSSVESDKQAKLSSKHRHCKRRKLRSSKDIEIIVSKDKTSVAAGFDDTATNAQLIGTSSSSSTVNNEEFLKKVTPPVKLVVNVLPSADCKIEIKNNNSNKRYVRSSAKQNFEKVKDWRTLFKNQDKLTESSYYSPPECISGKLNNNSSEEYAQEEVIPHSKTIATRDIGHYVRKLLLMSPESIDNLNVSSCSTTCIDSSSISASIDSNSFSKTFHRVRKEPQSEAISSSHEVTTEQNQPDDTENARQLLLKCLKLAVAEVPANINLSAFKSIDSTYDNNTATDPNDSNISYKNFINSAIQRLLPLYQNSLDDNLDYTVQSTTALCDMQQILNRSAKQDDVDQSDIDISKEDSAYISTSAYLHKFVSSLSVATSSGNVNGKTDDVIEYLKQYIESQSSPEKYSNKIIEDSCDSTANENVPSNDESYVSLPSIEELVRKGLISKSHASNESQNEPKQFIDEEEFLKKILQIDFTTTGQSEPKDDFGQIKFDNDNNVDASSLQHQSETDEKYSTDIIKELRKLGLNWMNTTLQRTLQASVINSTSSAEDSAGPLRTIAQLSSNFPSNSSSNCTVEHRQVTSQQSGPLFSISPITVPDLQLSVPPCFKKL